MFELEYKITDADMKAVNKRIMWQFFIPYVVVALLGIAAGVTAVVLQPRSEMLVLGIILIVLAAILLVCAVLMAIAPKNFVVSALLPNDDVSRVLEIGERGVTVKTPEQSDITVSYAEIIKVKDRKTYALLYVGKDAVILLKDAVKSGGTFAELVAMLKNKTTAQNAQAQAADEKTAENPAEAQTADAPAAEESDTEEAVASQESDEEKVGATDDGDKAE